MIVILKCFWFYITLLVNLFLIILLLYYKVLFFYYIRINFLFKLNSKFIIINWTLTSTWFVTLIYSLYIIRFLWQFSIFSHKFYLRILRRFKLTLVYCVLKIVKIINSFIKIYISKISCIIFLIYRRKERILLFFLLRIPWF